MSLVVTALAWWIHQLPFVPFTIEGAELEHPIGVSILAILLGILVANVASVGPLLVGCKWVTRWGIPIAVVLLGAGVNLTALGEIGWKLFGVIIVMMLLAMGVAYGLGRAFGMSAKSSYLLGVGTAVCGSSAILAVSPVSGADDEDVVVSVGVVNLVGLLAMFTCAATLWFIPLNAEIFGAWAGVTIHAVPQVIAAAESHSTDAVTMATLVKLTRVTLLAPLVLVTALWVSRRASGAGVSKKKKSLLAHLPWFVWGFMALLCLRSMGWLPVFEFNNQADGMVRISMSELLPAIAKWLLAISMAAIGLQVQLKPMLKTGVRAMAVGILTWLVMSAAALVMLWLLL